MSPHIILIGLGANLNGIYGTAEQCLRRCPDILAAAGIYVTQSSHIWKSAPVPVSDQPWYYNAVCTVETEHDPHDLLAHLARLENEAGRTREEPNAPRTLDLDILSYHNHIITDEHLQLPHPEMHKRAFVLYPLREIAPNWRHPSTNKSVDEMIKTLPTEQKIKCLDGEQKLYTYGDIVQSSSPRSCAGKA